MRKFICFLALLFTVSCANINQSIAKSPVSFEEATTLFNKQDFFFTALDYVDEEYAIFHTVDLLVVYDIKKQKFDNAINLNDYDAGHMQGSVITKFSVSEDGNHVFFKNYEGSETPENQRKSYNLYQYDIVNRQITTIENGEITDTTNIYMDTIYSGDYFTSVSDYDENNLISMTLCKGQDNQYLALVYKKQDLQSMKLTTYENQEIIKETTLFK